MPRGVGRRLLGAGSKPAYGVRGVGGAAPRGAGAKPVPSRFRAARDRGLVDTAVDLYPDRVLAVTDEPARAGDLREYDVEETLPAEPRLDGHQQDHVDLGQEVCKGLYGSRGLEGDAGARARC